MKSLSHALFSPAQAAVLSELFGQTQRMFHVQELMRLTGLGSASLQREVNRLLEAGLLREQRTGNLRHLQANEQSPLFAEVRSIVEKTLGLPVALRQALMLVADRMQTAILFGSHAKGQAHAQSDIDVMIVSDELSQQELLQRLLPLEKRLGQRISLMLYTQKEFEARRKQAHSLVNQVLGGPHQLLWGQL
jgi:predicted nucleotidyltransferase